MVQNMRVTIIMGKNKESGIFFSLMDHDSLENLKIIKLMERECIPGLMIESMKEIEWTIRWMVMEFLNGLMERSLTGNIKQTKNMGMVFLPGLMDVSTRDYGSTENSTGRANILVAMV